MIKYFTLQLKRAWKVLPAAILVSVILFSGLLVVLTGLMNMLTNSKENQIFVVGVTGDLDNEYLQWGMTALQTVDESRFTIEFQEMTRQEAITALEKGKISAYVVIPDEFMDKAFYGEILPLTFVTTEGMEDMGVLMKNEITKMVTDILVYSQKGVFGVADMLQDNGIMNVGRDMNALSLSYTEMILQRSKLYEVKELGISGGLSTPQYFVCAIVVVLLILGGLPYVPTYVKQDYALSRVLVSRGHTVFRQVISEYAAHFVAMLVQAEILFLAVGIGLNFMPEALSEMKAAGVILEFAQKAVLVVLMLSAFNLMIFELSGNIISGVLLHFFLSLALCYISGCMYPIYAFPESIQKIAPYLPTGMARNYLASTFTYASVGFEQIGLMLYTVSFFAVGFAVRFYQTAGRRGWRK